MAAARLYRWLAHLPTFSLLAALAVHSNRKNAFWFLMCNNIQLYSIGKAVLLLLM